MQIKIMLILIKQLQKNSNYYVIKTFFFKFITVLRSFLSPLPGLSETDVVIVG